MGSLSASPRNRPPSRQNLDYLTPSGTFCGVSYIVQCEPIKAVGQKILPAIRWRGIGEVSCATKEIATHIVGNKSEERRTQDTFNEEAEAPNGVGKDLKICSLIKWTGCFIYK